MLGEGDALISIYNRSQDIIPTYKTGRVQYWAHGMFQALSAFSSCTHCNVTVTLSADSAINPEYIGRAIFKLLLKHCQFIEIIRFILVYVNTSLGDILHFLSSPSERVHKSMFNCILSKGEPVY